MNLGKALRITFRAASDRRSRTLPVQQMVLSFRPVNHHLQRLHRVSATTACLLPDIFVKRLTLHS